jgi:hypothetical protein
MMPSSLDGNQFVVSLWFADASVIETGADDFPLSGP